jgi:hypothetical protein
MAQGCGSRKSPEESDDSGTAASQLISGIGSFRMVGTRSGAASPINVNCEVRAQGANVTDRLSDLHVGDARTQMDREGR